MDSVSGLIHESKHALPVSCLSITEILLEISLHRMKVSLSRGSKNGFESESVNPRSICLRFTLYHHAFQPREFEREGFFASTGQELDALCEFLSGTDGQKDQVLPLRTRCLKSGSEFESRGN